MPSLDELTKQLKDYPDRKRLGAQVNRLKEYQVKLGEAEKNLGQARRERLLAGKVFNPLLKVAVAEEERAAKGAKRLLKRIQNRPEVLEDGEADEDITKIRESCGAAVSELKKAWGEALGQRVIDLKPLVELAKVIQQSGSLSPTLELLRNHRLPPSTEGDATQVLAAIDAILKAVANMGLGGVGGQFLKDATLGLGNPKALLVPEVQEFLTQNSLWDLLKIGLR